MNKERIAFIPKQYFAVVAVLLAIMMSVLDGTIMNIALPTLAHDFDVTPSTAIWIVNAYQLVITMTLLSFASLGDIYGYRRVFLIGISIFVASSLACALSTSFWMLTASRVVQGFGAACVMSVNTALIRLIYPPQILGRGMGVNAMVVVQLLPVHPLPEASWHWEAGTGCLSSIFRWGLPHLSSGTNCYPIIRLRKTNINLTVSVPLPMH